LQGKVNLKTVYGQSENSLGALADVKTAASSPSDMGYAWAANCWIVNVQDHNQLAPIGACGELLLEGPCLAKGYLNNKEHTTAAFIYNPTWLQDVRPGENGRFLKTGDLVRYRPEDGLLQYVGRNGTQVKLRGQRIELAEVEFQLKRQFPESATVVADIVAPLQGSFHNSILVAFITVMDQGAQDQAATGVPFLVETTADFANRAQKAIASLHETLPGFMVPRAFLPVVSMPLTPSGKLNRRVLRNEAAELGSRLQQYHLLSKKLHHPPSTESELKIQRICARILSVEPMSINMNHNFFEAGGNPLLAMQLVSEAREIGFSFTTQTIFQQQSLAALSENVEQSPKLNHGFIPTTKDPSTTVLKTKFLQQNPKTFDPDNIADVFPCTPTQQWLFNSHEEVASYFESLGR
jgi:hypothetical protein